MLSVARSCTRFAPTRAILKNGFGTQSFYRTAQKSPPTSFSLRLFQRGQTQFTQVEGLLQRTKNQSVRRASAMGQKSQKIVGSWLLTCSGMVFVAVALGGITRLTESGLSMVTWKFLGEKMPSGETQWIEEFERYKEYPEYKILNKGMTLEEFKKIWWMEYMHRMWGRLIGITFALPATFFWATGMLMPAVKPRVLILGSLIGLQGLMGWYMVKSGLEDRFDGPSDIPRVSQYRLASHLGLALLIYTGFLYNAFDHLFPAKKMDLDLFGTRNIPVKIFNGLRKFKRFVYTTKGLVFATAISGAFVAGLDAGLIYNTFPKMSDRWIPDDLFAHKPIYRNFTENPTMVQFEHRILGITTLTVITLMGLRSRKFDLPGRGSAAVKAVVCAGYLQVFIGVTTLLYHVLVPLAAMHQSGSLILLSTVTWLCHEMKHVKKIIK
ncbi:cytochrome c oxidase assembly protein COX15 homolog [Venturia canescens]|uniref:cytochrome c oxidase assembly protein COX15 homolog n=1 Tax=Venturia canescens TaxID=32260 RepID=UPI001C9CCB5A|nr:cytochrome c oxidase assembly protein COX15 homolog [Venturia canescens]XP_043267367.1 cytochrome c oxidase assembly protein COX15 homolog [Venturia canescens]XP_043267368.1 cytochrome c oxidase assembly protein COX15 homolog [Venturia canescens]XP_043267369.1 cytochrome c oxidase assembly protein COX15 homolog [Venturia canescens]XP_043267370.1 cytochrome c oxidase assembly protein COX15 homolog [Venturia canescens]